MKRIAQIILVIVIMIIGITYLYVNRSQLAVLNKINPADIIILFLLIFLFFYITGYTFNLLVSLLGVKLSITEIMGLSILTNFVNYLGPIRPGAVFKAIYLKASRGFLYTRFASVLAANMFLSFIMTGGIGIILLLLMKKENIQTPLILFLACIGLVFGAVLPFTHKIPKLKKKNRISELLQSSLEGFEIIRSQKTKLFFICLTFIVQFLVAALVNIVVFHSVGVSITVLSALVIGVFASMANFFTITPNNLGVQEAVIAYLFAVTGFDFTIGVIGAGLIRVIHMIITFVFTPVFTHYLLKSANLSLGKILTKDNR